MVKICDIEQIKKRDGRIVAFDQTKIVAAIMKAAQAVQGSDYKLAEELAAKVVDALAADAPGKLPSVESIQDTIEKVLIAQGHARTAKAFILYRARRSRIREGKSELMEAVADLLQADSPSGASMGMPAGKLQAIGLAASREYYLNRFLPEAMAEAHLNGELHIHGLAHYAKTPHSFVLPYQRLLCEGFFSGHAFVRAPRRADSAAALTGLMLQAGQAEGYGGQVLPHFDEAFAQALPAGTSEAEIMQAMEALVFSLNALPPRHGDRLPLATLQVGTATSETGRMVTRALLTAFAEGLGRGEVALRPHLVFNLRAGVNLAEGEANFDLLCQAAAVAAKRPGLTFVHDEAAAAYVGHEARVVCEAAQGGAGQVGRVTLNLPRIALKARRDRQDFFEALEAAVDLAASILLHRHEALAVRQVADFPFTMGQGLYQGAGGLKPQDEVRPALQHGQLAIGIVGLAQTLVVLSGQHHGASPSSQAEGLAIVKRIAERCARISSDSGLRLVLQAADAHAVGDRFARLDRREFGLIKGVTEGASYASGVALPEDAEAAMGDRLALEGVYSEHLLGGNFHVSRAAQAPDAAGMLAWVQSAVAAGVPAFALDYPQVQCLGCGLPNPAGGSCSRCDAPLASAVPVVRRRGYLSLGES